MNRKKRTHETWTSRQSSRATFKIERMFGVFFKALVKIMGTRKSLLLKLAMGDFRTGLVSTSFFGKHLNGEKLDLILGSSLLACHMPETL